MTSEGYPDSAGTGMKLGKPIEIAPGTNDNTQVFFAGVKNKDGVLVNSGGRVLGVTALSKTVEEARRKAYARIEKIRFDGAHWRKDIGSQ
jgi:phosphoribosylamine--glycine ligase